MNFHHFVNGAYHQTLPAKSIEEAAAQVEVISPEIKFHIINEDWADAFPANGDEHLIMIAA